MNKLGVLVAVSLACRLMGASLELSALFSDHAVLQTGTNVPVWGWADPGQEVTVQFAGQNRISVTAADGRWEVRLDLPEPSAKGRVMTVLSGPERRVAKDILVGEVWLGSGQSNMRMQVSKANDADQEAVAADIPLIRMFREDSRSSIVRQNRVRGQWVVCSPETVTDFSATLYFFGREIQKTLGGAVGLINSSVGGSPIESWICSEAQQASPELAGFFRAKNRADAAFDADAERARYEQALTEWTEEDRQAKRAGTAAPPRPQNLIELRERKGDVGGLFNAKIFPLAPYAVRGIVWYQGEANTGAKSVYYQNQLSLLVQEWRRLWGHPVPFVFVQLPNFRAKRGQGWMQVREAVRRVQQELSDCGTMVTLDAGDPDDIHPKNKQTVGYRLACWALNTVYGGGGAASGPLPSEYMIQGSGMRVTFSHADQGLILRPGPDGCSGFEVAGRDEVWHSASAEIDGNSIKLFSPHVPAPEWVRYAWAEVADAALWNGAGLPASPFLNGPSL